MSQGKGEPDGTIRVKTMQGVVCAMADVFNGRRNVPVRIIRRGGLSTLQGLYIDSQFGRLMLSSLCFKYTMDIVDGVVVIKLRGNAK